MPHLTINYLMTPNNCSNPVLILIVPSPLHRVAIVACLFTLLFSLRGYSFSKSVWEETVITPPPKPIWNSLIPFSFLHNTEWRPLKAEYLEVTKIRVKRKNLQRWAYCEMQPLQGLSHWTGSLTTLGITVVPSQTTTTTHMMVQHKA